ncbi:universal stress protein [Halobacteriaceae archaeon SHR40]|uniref:universal stress protein n=1 Tax=Halovenus amylolytica TaxID=2500550 RepID=UPI000FE30804
MTVLVPYDGSEQAQYALAAAGERFPDEKLILLYVLEPYANHTEAGGHSSEGADQAQQRAEQLLAEGVDSLPDGVTAETAISYGRPVHELIRFVEENAVEQIVMGSHGRDGTERLLLGSVAETVVRRSSVPVTVVRRKTVGTPDRVLIPFDGSQESRRALSYAIEGYPEAELTALYVSYPDKLAGPDKLSPGSVDVAETAAETESILDVAKKTAEAADASITVETTEGDPARSIVSYAEAELVDHIVMGSHGRDGLTRLLLGSVAETVVRRAPTSVTVVR